MGAVNEQARLWAGLDRVVMLNFLRNFKRTIMGLIALVFMVVLMLTFGMNGPSSFSSGRRNPETPALVVNGREVSQHEYSEQVRAMDAMGRKQFGANYEKIKGMLNVPGRVVDNLISQNLFYILISDLGLDAGVSQVREYILQTYFPTGFNRDLYENLLRQSGVTEEQHQERVRRQIAASQLQDLLADVSFVSDAELKNKYRIENTKYAFNYFALSPAAFEAKVNLSDDPALLKYYEDNKAQFKKGKSVGYTVVEFPSEEFAAKVDVTADDLEETYQTAIKQFTEPRQVLVKRIAFAKQKIAPASLEEMMDPEKKVQAPDSEEKKKKAEAALKRLKDGEDFEKVRAELTESVSGPGSVEEGVWLNAGTLEPKFRSAAQKLQKGEFSSVLETDSGFFIVRIEDLKPQRVKPLEEVKAEVEAMVRKNLAPTYAIASAENFINEWDKKSKDAEISLADFAAAQSRSAKSAERLYFEGEAPAGLPAAITSKAFTIGKGGRESVTVAGRVFVIDVIDFKSPYVPDFEQVKEAVAQSYKTAKAKELALAAAQAIIDQAAAKPPGAGISRLAPEAKKHGIEIKLSEPKSRSEASSSEPFENPAAVEAAFALNDAEPLTLKPVDAGSRMLVLELASKSLPDEGGWSARRADYVKGEMQRGGQSLAQALLGNLKRHATIVDNTVTERAAAAAPLPEPIEH